MLEDGYYTLIAVITRANKGKVSTGMQKRTFKDKTGLHTTVASIVWNMKVEKAEMMKSKDATLREDDSKQDNKTARNKHIIIHTVSSYQWQDRTHEKSCSRRPLLCTALQWQRADTLNGTL